MINDSMVQNILEMSSSLYSSLAHSQTICSHVSPKVLIQNRCEMYDNDLGRSFLLWWNRMLKGHVTANLVIADRFGQIAVAYLHKSHLLRD